MEIVGANRYQFRRVASGIRKVGFHDAPGITGRLLGDDEVCDQIGRIIAYGSHEHSDSKLTRIIEILARSSRYSEYVA